MAQNLLIGPQVVPIRGQPARVPLESPQLAQAKEATGHLETMMSHLLRSSVTQEQSNTSVDAYVYYRNKLADLETNIDKIPTYDDKMTALSKGMDAIKSDLRKDYPTLPPTALKGIELEMIGASKEIQIKAVNERRTEANREFNRKLKDLGDLAAGAHSTDELSAAETRAHKLIEDAAKPDAGFIHPDEVADKKQIFDRKVRADRFAILVAIDPVKALNVPFEASGLSPKAYGEAIRGAHEAINAEHLQVEDSFHKQQDQVVKDIQSGKQDPNDPRIYWLLPEGMRNALRRPPPSDEEVNSITHEIGALDNVEAINKYRRDKINHMHLTPEQSKTINEALSEQMKVATSDYHKSIAAGQNYLYDYLAKRHVWKAIGFPDPMKLEVDSLKRSIKNLPNIVNNPKGVEDGIKSLREEINKTFPLPGEKKPAAKSTAAAPSAPASPAAVTPNVTVAPETPTPATRTTPIEEPVPVGTPTPEPPSAEYNRTEPEE